MYFHGTLSIDPSQMTDIELVKPTKAFGKMLHYMTLGLSSGEEERETFTAVGILQQFNRAFRSLGITNVLRLARDDEDYYLDQEGREDDLKQAMAAFHQHDSSTGQQAFNTLRLVLEHEDESLKYLLQIEVQRTHKVGEHPILVTLNGLMKDMCVDSEQDDAAVRYLLSPHFESQQAYDSCTDGHKAHFDSFLNQIEQAICEHIGVDRVSRSSESHLIRPSKPVKRRDQWQRSDGYDPVYYGYYEHDDYFYYSWMWSDMCHQNNIHCHDCFVVDDQGQTVFEVGEEGFEAGETDALNPEAPMELPAGVDVHSNNAFSETLGATVPSADVGTDTSSGWLDSFSFSFSLCGGGGDGGGDGGGGCGGGCGG
ncbi:MAG: hypothetical protein ABGZ23_30940 [Fuerstiella sp.]